MPDKIKILYDAVSKDYNVGNFDEFQKKLQDDTKRKAFYDGVGAEYNLGNFDEFSSKVKKKEPTTSDSQSGSPISSKPFDVFQTERNKKSTFNAITGELKPYVEPKEEKPKFDFNAIKSINPYAGKTPEEISRMPMEEVVGAERQKLASIESYKKKENTYYNKEKAKYLDYYKSVNKRTGEDETYLNVPSQFLSSVSAFLTKPAKGILTAVRDISSSISETTGQGKLPDISDPNYNPEADDLVGMAIRKLDFQDAFYDARKEAFTLPNTLGGKTTQGIIDAIPLVGSMATGNVSSAGTQLFNEVNTTNKIIQNAALNPLTKTLMKQGAISTYGESRATGENVQQSIKKSGEAAIEGFKSGTELASMGGLAGRLTPKILGSLAEKGLIAGTGEATEKITHALIMGASGGGLSAAKDVLSGNEVDWDKAKEQSTLFLAFEITPVAKAIGAEVIEPIRKGIIDRSVVDNATKSIMNTDVLNINATRNFLNADLDVINVANKVEGTPQDLQYKSLEEGVKALDAKTSQEKASHFINQDRVQKISDIKYVTENILRDKDGVIKSIEEMDLPDNVKQQYIDKVNDVYESNHPDEISKQELAGEVQLKKDKTVELDATIKNSKDPIKVAKAEIEKQKLEKEINEANEKLKEKVSIPNRNIDEIKPEENAIQKPSTTEEVSRTGETRQVITESGKGVRPSEQGKETTKEVSKEEALKDVESTAKALESIDKNSWGTTKGLSDNFYTTDVDGYAIKKPITNASSVTIDGVDFHIAKIDGDWKVVEKKSGLEISTGKTSNTKNAAIEDATMRLKQNGGANNLPTLIDRAIQGFKDRNTKSVESLLGKQEVAPKEVKSVEQLTADAKKAKTKVAKTEALQKLKEQATAEEYKTFIEENPTYKKYEVKQPKTEKVEVEEKNDSLEVEVTPEVKSKYEAKKEELNNQEQEILNRLKKRLGNLNAGFNPEVIPDLIELGSVYIQKGVITFREFADKMIADYGSDIPEKNLRDIYNSSANKLGLGIRRTPERVATDEGLSPKLREIANETESVYQRQDYKEVQEKLDNMTEAEKNALVGTLANVTGELNIEGNVGVLAAIDLINSYEAKGDKANASRVFDIISKSATTLAQLLRQYGQLKSSTPQGYVQLIEKAMKDKFGVKLTDVQKQAIERLYRKTKFATDLEKNILDDLADKIENDPSFKSKDGYKKLGKTTVMLENANRNLEDYIESLKPLTTERFWGNRTSTSQGNLLSIKSLLVNPFANIVQATTRLTINEVSNLFDFINSVALGSERTKISAFDFDAVRLSMKAAAKGLGKAGRILMKGQANSELAKLDITGTRLKPFVAMKSLAKTITGKQAFEFSKTLDDILQSTSGLTANLALRLLPFGDIPINEQARVFKLVEIGKRQFKLKGKALEAFVLKPDAESAKIAQEVGDDATLQSQNKIYTGVNQLLNIADTKSDKKLARQISASAKFATRGLVVPFLKTPINYATKVIRLSNPIIPLTQAALEFADLAKAYKIKEKSLRDKSIQRHQSNMHEYFGEAIIGQSIMAVASIIVSKGLVTGDAPKDNKDKKEKDLMYATGGPNMLNISGLKRLLSGGNPEFRPEDKLVSLNPFGILGAQIGIQSNTLTAEKKEEIRKSKFVTTEGKPFYEDKGFYLTSVGDLLSNIPATLRFTLNQGFVQGTGAILSAMESGEYGSWSNQLLKTLAIGQTAGGNTLSQSLKAGNEYYRNKYGVEESETLANTIKDIYGNVDNLPINYDMWGKPIKNTPSGTNPYVYSVLDIFKTKNITDEKYTYYLLDLYRKTNNKSIIPTSVSDVIGEDDDLKKEKLNPAQRAELQRIVGEERYKYITGNDDFGSLSLKEYDVNNLNQEYIDEQVFKLKKANELGLKYGKIRFKTEILKIED